MDPEELDKLRNASIDLQGNCPGVYFLFDGDELVYVGKGQNCFLRVAEHTRKDKYKKFTTWNHIPIEDEDDINAFERYLIETLKPKLNKMFNNA